MSMPTADDLATCVYCPKLCRHVCPVAVGTGREAAAPSNMALHPFRFLRGQGELSEALDAASLCTGCGACTTHCDLHRPLGDLLGQLVHAMSPPPVPAPLGEVEGTGRYVAIETDERRWADALGAHLGEPVARLRSADHLGAGALAHPLADPSHGRALRELLAGRTAVVSDHRALAAARTAGVAVTHLVDLVPPSGDGPVHHPCHGPRLPGQSPVLALACCGATGALEARHPDLVAEVAATQARNLGDGLAAGASVRSPDTTCATALRAAGLAVRDPVDSLLAAAT